MNRGIRILDLALCPYRAALDLQRRLQRELIAGSGREHLLLCEHPSVITLGTSARRTNILTSPGILRERGFDIVEVERGGDVTYHGPGQLVAYPFLDLRLRQQDVGWYMRSLEEAAIRTLAHFGITGGRIAGRTGVWLEPDCRRPVRKMVSIGVRISRWCTMHGLALNVHSQQDGFRHIHPCGLVGAQVTSLEEETGRPPALQEVAAAFTRRFGEIFGTLEVEDNQSCRPAAPA